MRKADRRGFLLPALCLAGICLFTALGIWQVERRAWKLDLVARLEQRVNAQPAPLPPRSTWSTLDRRDIEYRRVALSGTFLHERETLVDALTELGAGYWVVTPLRTSEGTVLVNRGFVPPARRAPTARPQGQVPGETTVNGLIRLSEPNGRILRPNRPAEDRWYSRDVAKIAAARGLRDAAPFFVDAGPEPNPGGYPVGGLTVIRFRNAHLTYALTWFALAALCVVGLTILIRNPASRQ